MPNETPPRRRIIVDGSNIATEGRSLPSLAQLDEAIRAFLDEYPGFTTADVTVVVDASFGHRIDESEVPAFEEAVLHGEMVTPPAGAVGRGDGFILRIAEKSGALVLSNDSFQEFHAERPWLFDEGRLIGGKPVPGVGWVFTPRTPVRGPKSRAVISRSKRDAKAGQDGDEGELTDASTAVDEGTEVTREGKPARRRRPPRRPRRPRRRRPPRRPRRSRPPRRPRRRRPPRLQRRPRRPRSLRAPSTDRPRRTAYRRRAGDRAVARDGDRAAGPTYLPAPPTVVPGTAPPRRRSTSR